MEVKEKLSYFVFEKILVGYEIAGVKLDLLIVKNEKCVAIDLVGCPGEHEEMLSIETWSMIYRTGIPVFYLPYSNWVFDKKKTVRALEFFLRENLDL